MLSSRDRKDIEEDRKDINMRRHILQRGGRIVV